MSAARTPVHSYYVDADFNVCYGSQIMEPLEIVATIETLTADNAALRKALAGIMERVDAAMAQGDEPGKGVAELLTAARSALAKAGAK